MASPKRLPLSFDASTVFLICSRVTTPKRKRTSPSRSSSTFVVTPMTLPPSK